MITFTKAAAGEMRERFERLMGGGRYRVVFGTFHAVFFQILKYAYHYTAANILRRIRGTGFCQSWRKGRGWNMRMKKNSFPA